MIAPEVGTAEFLVKDDERERLAIISEASYAFTS